MAGATALSLALLAGAAASLPAPVSDVAMRAATDRLLAEVSAVRRLPTGAAFERRVETRSGARSRCAAELAAGAADPEFAARVRLWERLGLLPEGFDVAQVVGAMVDVAPTASYDPLGRRLVVPDWIPLSEQRPALAHALAHALTDQRFGVRDLLQIDLEGRHHLDGDAERARLALVEGDATVTALELSDPSGALTGAHALPALADAVGANPDLAPPLWLRANAGFAHGDGLAFVARVRGRQPWSAVDALWSAPPQSSEQILHPRKYDAHEAPVAVPPPPPRTFGDAFRVDATDVLGELGVREWLATEVPALIAERAATGWGGDRATLFVPVAPPAPDAGVSPPSDAGAPAPLARDAGVLQPPFVVWSTVWDDLTDAEDFARTAAQALAARAGDPSAASDDPHRFVAHGAEGVFALAWQGGAVALLVGAPDSALATLDGLLARPQTKVKAPTQAPAMSGPSPRPSPAKRARGSR